MSVESVLEMAGKLSPVADPTPGLFAGNLELLINSINDEARMSEAGVAACTRMLASAQAKRNEVSHWLANEPRIGEQSVERPVFLTGLPRSGTTYFQYLFDREPSLRMMRTWEGDMHP